jgi:ATP-binding cassette, subfamily C (CFTR/MRP), member 1
LWLSANSRHEVTYTLVFTVATSLKAVLILLESQRKDRWLRWERKTHSPEEVSGLHGLGTFFWLNSLFFSDYTKILSLPDIFVLDDKMRADVLQLSCSKQLEQTGFPGPKYPLARALASIVVVPILLPVIPRIALLVLGFCQPKTLLDYLNQPEDKNKIYGLIGATVLVYTGIPIMTAFYWYLNERALFVTRACLLSAVYRKTTQANGSVADNSVLLP